MIYKSLVDFRVFKTIFNHTIELVNFWYLYSGNDPYVYEIINDDSAFKYITGRDRIHNKTSEVNSVGFVDNISHIMIW